MLLMVLDDNHEVCFVMTWKEGDIAYLKKSSVCLPGGSDGTQRCMRVAGTVTTVPTECGSRVLLLH
jgi:hypothetical protein